MAAQSRRRPKGGPDEPKSAFRHHRLGNRPGMDDTHFLAAGGGQRRDRRLRLVPAPRATNAFAARAVVVPVYYRRVLVAAKPVEDTPVLHRPSGRADNKPERPL